MKNNLYFVLALFCFLLPFKNQSQSNCLNFDGVNDYVAVGNPSQLNFGTTNPFTIEVWLKTSSTGRLNIFSKMANTQPFTGYELLMLNGKISIYIINTYTNVSMGNYIEAETINTFNDNAWHHVSFSYNGNSNVSGVRIYVDGTLQTLTTLYNTLSGSIITSVPVSIGTRQGVNSFNGSLDEIRVWSYVRSQTQVQNAKNKELVGNECSLIAYYNCNQGVASAANPTVTTLNDLTANNLDGNLNNFSLNGSTSNWITPGGNVSGFYAPNLFTLSSTDTLCINSLPVTLTGGDPIGGTYSGAGVSSGQFNPATAGLGNHTISYSSTDINSCVTVAQATITVLACTGINEIINESNQAMIVYPNPSNGQFVFECSEFNENSILTLYNCIGQKVWSTNVKQSKMEISINELTTGIYFLVYNNAAKNNSKRIIIE